MSVETTVSMPDYARCLGCDYPLRGLSEPRCPECGRPFDPADPATVNLGRRIGRVGRFLLKPIGRPTALLAALATAAAAFSTGRPDALSSASFIDVSYFARPGAWRDGTLIRTEDYLYAGALWAWAVVLAVWVLRSLLRVATGAVRWQRRPLYPTRWGRQAFIALALGLMVALVLTGWPGRLGRNWAGRELAASMPNVRPSTATSAQLLPWFGPPPVRPPDVLPYEQHVRVLSTVVHSRRPTALRTAAIKLLIEDYTAEALPVLLREVGEDNNPAVRATRLRLAGLYRDRDSVPAILPSLGAAEPEVRAAAADALGIIHRPAYLVPNQSMGGFSPDAELDTRPPIACWAILRYTQSLWDADENGDGIRDADLPRRTVPLADSVRQSLEQMMLRGATSPEREAAARALVGWPPANYRLRVAEWGVWIADDGDGGGVKLVQSVLDELPPFVHHTGNPVGDFADRVNRIIFIDKPVLHLTADRPMAVDLEVHIRQGRPWFAYPRPDDFNLSTKVHSNRFRCDAPERSDLVKNVLPLASSAVPPLTIGVGQPSSKKQVPPLESFDRPGLAPLDDPREGYPWLSPHHRRYGSMSGRVGDDGNLIVGMGLRWQSLIVNPGRLAWMVPPDVGTDPKFRWWAALRDVPCAWVSSRGEAERFVYYDGPTRARAPMTVTVDGDRVQFDAPQVPKSFEAGDDSILTTGKKARSRQAAVGEVEPYLGMPQDPGRHRLERDGLLVRIAGGRAAGWRVEVPAPLKNHHGDPTSDLRPADTVRLRHQPDVLGRAVEEQFLAMLTARGLTQAEAGGLIGSWRDHFFRTDGTRFLLLMAPADYDGFCPIRVRPEPTELIRVGVLLTEIRPPGTAGAAPR